MAYKRKRKGSRRKKSSGGRGKKVFVIRCGRKGGKPSISRRKVK